MNNNIDFDKESTPVVRSNRAYSELEIYGPCVVIFNGDCSVVPVEISSEYDDPDQLDGYLEVDNVSGKSITFNHIGTFKICYSMWPIDEDPPEIRFRELKT